MKPTLAVLYGDAGSAALIHAVKDWRKNHAPQAAFEELMKQYIRSIEISTNVRPDEPITISIAIRGRRRSDFDQYYFEATVVGGELKLESITD